MSESAPTTGQGEAVASSTDDAMDVSVEDKTAAAVQNESMAESQEEKDDKEVVTEEKVEETEEEKAAKAKAAELAALNDDLVDGEGYEYVINENLEDMGDYEDDEEGDADQPQVVFRYSHGAQSRQAEEDPLMKKYGVTTQNYPDFSAQLGRRQTPFEISLDTLEEKAWRRQGATLDDFFNFGFNEQTWREYAAKQVALRLKAMDEKTEKEFITNMEESTAQPKPEESS
mmetsp:Transcript_6904/g.7946  ORF Transcript_6904/g.7946 Transcript_6904/m.7946 type:complete len:229 (-) Transcript_6904:74-760(-)